MSAETEQIRAEIAMYEREFYRAMDTACGAGDRLIREIPPEFGEPNADPEVWLKRLAQMVPALDRAASVTRDAEYAARSSWAEIRKLAARLAEFEG